MTNFEKKLKSIFSIDDTTLLVAFLPVLGYCIAYTFESGYLQYFDIPAHFVQIDLIMLLKATVAVIFSLYLIMTMFGLSIDLQNKSHPFCKVLGHSLFLTSLVAIFAFINIGISLEQATSITIGLYLIFVLLQLIPPLFNKDLITYWQRVTLIYPANYDSNNSSDKPRSIFNDLIFKGVIFLFLFTFVYELGMSSAKNETQFLTFKHNPEMIVIRIYEDTIIAKNIDLTTYETNDDIEIFKIDSTPLSMTMTSIKHVKTKTGKRFLNQFKSK